jgi:hypothetical protein
MVDAETAIIAHKEKIPAVVNLNAGLKPNDGGIGSEVFVDYKAVTNFSGFNSKPEIVPKIPKPYIGFEGHHP